MATDLSELHTKYEMHLYVVQIDRTKQGRRASGSSSNKNERNTLSTCDLSIETTVNQPYETVSAMYQQDAFNNKVLQQEGFDNKSFNSKVVNKRTATSKVYEGVRIPYSKFNQQTAKSKKAHFQALKELDDIKIRKELLMIASSCQELEKLDLV